MIATKIDHGSRAQLNRHALSGDHYRYCSICGKQQPTERGKFTPHQTPAGKPCGNSGKSVKATQEEAQG